MDFEFTNAFEDLISGYAVANKTAVSNLIKRCLIKSIIKKEAFSALILEVDKWDGRNI